MSFKKVFILAILSLSLFISIRTKQIEKLRDLKCDNCNVIIIGIDALRADHLGAYGYARPTSPNIDFLSQKSIIFKNNYSQSITTSPSFMSIFTSLYPTDHGILFTNPASYGYPLVKINDKIKTLPQIIQNNDYTTNALVSSLAIPPEIGFSKGFDEFTKDSVENQRKKLFNFISQNKDKKFFIFYHDLTTHAPYIPNEKNLSFFEERKSVTNTLENPQKIFSVKDFFSTFDKNDPKSIQHLTNLYDATIKNVDDFIGELIVNLEKEKLMNRTIIIFTSDHGEELNDHGKFDHQQFYNEIAHVPLIIYNPKIDKGITINQISRSIDIMPTIFDFLGIKVDSQIRGKSLAPMILNPEKNIKLPAITVMGAGKSLTIGEFKLIDQTAFQTHLEKPITLELYNLSRDPKEENNLINTNNLEQDSLIKSYSDIINDNNYSKTPDIININPNDKTINELRRLGY